MLVWMCLCLAVVQAADVAFNKAYTLSQPGYIDFVFSNHLAADYEYVPIPSTDNEVRMLTTNMGMTIPRYGLMWINHALDYNVTLTIDAETSVSPQKLAILGHCCNMGLFTPVAAYAYGSDSANGPWDFLGAKQGLTAGDQIDTPATRYELHAILDNNRSHRYFRISVTGLAGHYISLTTVQLFD